MGFPLPPVIPVVTQIIDNLTGGCQASEGNAALTGAGSLTARGALAGTAVLIGTGSLAAVPDFAGISPMSGTGSLAGAAAFAAAAPASGSGALTAGGAFADASTWSGDGSLTTAGHAVRQHAASLTGDGYLAAAAPGITAPGTGPARHYQPWTVSGVPGFGACTSNCSH